MIQKITTKDGGKSLPNNKTLVTFKMDKDLKLRINKLTEEVGVPFSTIVNSLLKQFERTKKFEIDLKRLSFGSGEELDEMLHQGLKSKTFKYENTDIYKQVQIIKSKK